MRGSAGKGEQAPLPAGAAPADAAPPAGTAAEPSAPAGPPAGTAPPGDATASGEAAAPADAPAGTQAGAAGVPAASPAGAGARPAVSQALRRLAPPRHRPKFWDDLDQRLADEPQLRLAPRSAIRPITQPPPVVDDRNLASSLGGDPLPPRRSRRRRNVLVAAVAVVALLVAAAALGDPGDDATTTGATTSETTEATRPAEGEDDVPPTEASPPPPPPGTVEPNAPLTPAGVGPLTVGTTLADLQAAGVMVQVDQATFDGSGGTCYDARVPGALDLLLRFRSPDGQRRAGEPGEGVLTSVSIETALPTARPTDTGLGLGTPQDQVIVTYGGNLDERRHPFLAGGRILRADNGDGRGVAFFTDGQVVVRVSVGEMEAIRFVNQCR